MGVGRRALIGTTSTRSQGDLAGARNSGMRALGMVLTVIVLSWGTTVAALENGQKFKDWTVRCGKAAEDKPEQCQILQEITTEEDSSQPVMVLAIAKPPEAKEPLLLFTVHPGIYLPPGILLQVDKSEPFRIPVEVCDPDGCKTGLPLEPKLVQSLKAGNTLKIVIHDRAGNRGNLKASLNGFTAALGAL